MKEILTKVLITAVLVVLLSNILKGIQVDGLLTAIIVAIVLGLLNIFVKPVFLFFTLPITVFTLGLFLLCVNAIMTLLCSFIVGGFHVDGFFTAFIFSIVLSVSQSILYKIFT